MGRLVEPTGEKEVVRPQPSLLDPLSIIPTITAFEQSPDHGRGLALERDMRVRSGLLEQIGRTAERARGPSQEQSRGKTFGATPTKLRSERKRR